MKRRIVRILSLKQWSELSTYHEQDLASLLVASLYFQTNPKANVNNRTCTTSPTRNAIHRRVRSQRLFVYRNWVTNHEFALGFQGSDKIGQNFLGVNSTFPAGLYDLLIQKVVHRAALLIYRTIRAQHTTHMLRSTLHTPYAVYNIDLLQIYIIPPSRFSSAASSQDKPPTEMFSCTAISKFYKQNQMLLYETHNFTPHRV